MFHHPLIVHRLLQLRLFPQLDLYLLDLPLVAAPLLPEALRPPVALQLRLEALLRLDLRLPRLILQQLLEVLQVLQLDLHRPPLVLRHLLVELPARLVVLPHSPLEPLPPGQAHLHQ